MTTDFPKYIISDVHGDYYALEKIIECAKKDNATMLLCCGDLCPRDPDFALLIRNLPFPFITVRGNCDSPWSFSDLSLPLPPYSKELAHYKKTIVLTHGHCYGPDNYLRPLNSEDIFISGHTHCPRLEIENGITLLNPGSISRPRTDKGPTFIKLYFDRAELFSFSSLSLLSTLRLSTL